jgi:thiamine-phosphate pyrophosphorylase
LILPAPPILIITDRRMADRPLTDIIAAALRGGGRWFLLREPDLPAADRLSLAASLAALCAPFGARLSVSADLLAAAAVQTTGIHLPQRMAQPETVATARAQLGPDALIGVSAHSSAEAMAAQTAGADYVTLSPVFLTDSKPGYGPALGPDGFRSLAAALDIPAVALGGIAAETVPSMRTAGAAGVAVMGGVMRADDPEGETQRLLSAWENGS